MEKPETDIMLAINHVKKDLPNVQNCGHMYVYQDIKKAKEKKEKVKKGMRIDCKIEQITAQERDGDSSGTDNSKNIARTVNSDLSDRSDIDNVMQELTIGLLNPIK